MNSAQVIVFKERSVTLSVALGMDVSNDTFVSEIRVDKDRTSTLIATWTIAFATDGTDGELIFTMDADTTGAITQTSGYMDIKRNIGGVDPVAAFDDPVEVLFKLPTTA